MKENTRLINTVYQTTPCVIHGNGPSKILLNSLGNYLAKSWTVDEGCLACGENTIDFSKKKVRLNFVLLLISVFEIHLL